MNDPDGLVAAARRGDSRAFEELVRQTYQDTYTLAFRLTGNEEDARDVVQDTYLRAWRGLRRFRGDAQFSTWLYRITANVAYSQVKRRRRHRHEPAVELAEVPEPSPASDPDAVAQASALRDEVSAAVAELPPKLRAVLVLRDVYGLTHEEIGEELGISVSAAKVRLHRARRRLHDVLFGDGRKVEHAV